MAKIIDFFSRRRTGSARFASKPWQANRTAIYDFLSSFPADAKLPNAADTLPDHVEFHAGKEGPRWVSGGLDGAFGHHAGAGEADAAGVIQVLARASAQPSSKTLDALYAELLRSSALSLADPLIQGLMATSIDPGNTFDIAHWLATRSPDREPVKFGIIMLGMFRNLPVDELVTLGRHDKFTLYAAVALSNLADARQREDVLWKLARDVDGWGRIQVVERLSETQNPDIKAWLLRDGYRNAVMYEYLAYTCAVSGDLVGALREDRVDDALLLGAAGILRALIMCGPAEDMSDYAQGAEASRLYIAHVERQMPEDLHHVLTLWFLQSFASNETDDWPKLESHGWTPPVRQSIVASARNVLSHAHWRTLTNEQLQIDHNPSFWLAAEAAEKLGLDPWPIRLERQRRGKDEWWHLMQTRDPVRVGLVLDLAREQLNLAALASGATREDGLGPEYAADQALDSITQELRDFPGLGADFVLTALQNRVIRNRFMALQALEAWTREHWPPETELLLSRALQTEPDEDARKAMRRLLDGQPLDEE